MRSPHLDARPAILTSSLELRRVAPSLRATDRRGIRQSVRADLASLVEDFRAHGRAPAVVAHRGVRRFATSYGELAELAGRFAAELMRRGIETNERVVLWGGELGGVDGRVLRLRAARGYWWFRSMRPERQSSRGRVIADVTPALIVGDGALLRMLSRPAATLTLEDLRSSLPREPRYGVSETVTNGAAFQIVFTSGTTGEPKGIVHTHRNVLASLSAIEEEIGRYRRYERLVHPLGFLHTLPLSHVFGQFMGLWVPALLGGVLHFTDAFDPSRIVLLAKRERLSVLVAVPRVLGLLRTYLLQASPELGAKLRGAEKLSAWKRWWRFREVHRQFGFKFWAVISGGAAVPDELERFWNALGFALIQGYGMTETAALVTLNHPFRVGRGTLGKTLPGREVRLSETGEILVRGDVVSQATWQEGGLRWRSEDWLATGDLAERTEGGDLRFVGRSGDAIVTGGGAECAPGRSRGGFAGAAGDEEVRGGAVPVRHRHGAGRGGVVRRHGAGVGVGTDAGQHRPCRAPEDSPNSALAEAGLSIYVERKVAAARSCGRGLAELSSNGGTTNPGTRDDDDLLVALIAEITGERTGGDGDQRRLSDDFHLDSLGRVQLASAIEQRTGLLVDDESMAQAVTLGDLRRLLSAAGLGGASVAATERGGGGCFAREREGRVRWC